MRFKKGLSFLELVIALAIISIGLVGLIQASNTALELNYRTSREVVAVNLAKGLLAEIISKNFVDPLDNSTNLGKNSGETTRNDFDDVDDYNGTSENPPRTVNATAMNGTAGTPNYSDFTRNATVIYVNFLANGTYDESQPATPTEYKKVSVAVTTPQIREINVSEYKSNTTQ